MKWAWTYIQFFVIFIVIELTVAGVILEEEEKAKTEISTDIPTETTIAINIISEIEESILDEKDDTPMVNDTLRTHSKDKYNKRKPTYEYDRDDNHHHHNYHSQHVIAVHDEPHYRPKCADSTEIFSSSSDCDVQCDNQGIIDHYDFHHDQFGFFRSSKSYSRCRRMVSDVLLEEGYKNITTREDLGYPAETKSEYLARTKRNYDHHGSSHHGRPEYVIVHSEPHYRPPPGECVCRKGYARLRGRCVPYGNCPQLNCKLATEAYVACAPCPKTCTNLLTYDAGTLGCVCSPRCVCKHGLVLSPNGHCVSESACQQFTQSSTTTSTTSTTSTTTTTTTAAPARSR